MSEDIYRQLQERLDQYSMGFPATESGIEIKILKYLFSEDDAAYFLALSPKLEPPDAVAGRMDLPLDQVSDQLEAMSRRGLLFRLERDGAVKYGAIPFVHGVFEFQVPNIDRNLSEMVEQYFNEGFHTAIQDGAEYFLRTVPVRQSVDTTRQIAAFDDAAEILRGKKSIVVTDCICRKQKGLLGQGCDKPLEACFMFGSMGKYYLDRGMGRQIELDEALDILAKCHEAGLVTQPATTQNPSGMCNCCGDCCGVLVAINKHPKPAEIVFSNHYAVVNGDDCTSCETCLERCQVGALAMNQEGLAEVNLDRCIGCGLCVLTCPTQAITLMPKEEDDLRVPPASGFDQMMLLAQKRGVI